MQSDHIDFIAASSQGSEPFVRTRGPRQCLTALIQTAITMFANLKGIPPPATPHDTFNWRGAANVTLTRVTSNVLGVLEHPGLDAGC